MAARRSLEIAGFVTIAAALHVSAAALMLTEQIQHGAPAEAPPATLAAGGEAVQSMVEAWETPPEIEMAADMTPQPQPEPEPEPLPETAADTPPDPVLPTPEPMPRPQPEMARPNLPEAPPPPPEPEPEPEIAEPEPEPALTLQASARPDPRPERRQRQQPERRQPQQTQQTPREAPQAPARQAPPPPKQAGHGGEARSGAGGGGGGVSAQQRASLVTQWGGQIRNCISRRAISSSGLRRGGRVVLNLTVARDGTIRGVGLAASSGDPRVDQAVVSAAQRVGRCPAAPAGLTDATYSFQLPITQEVR